MAYFDTTWYCNAGDQATTGHYATPKRAASTAYVAGQIVRQFTAPAVNSERVFICIIAGTTSSATDATWVLTRGAKTVDGTVTWMECSGAAALNGDLVNTPSWTQARAISTAVSIGAIIKRNNGASLQICTTAGSTSASEPAFSDTAGVTTVDNAATWTSLGPPSGYTPMMALHARVANALTASWWVGGNTLWVGDNHAESQSGIITATGALSNSAISRVICHDHAGSYPPSSADLRTTAIISSVSNVNLTSTAGMIYWYGFTFRCGVGAAGVGLGVGLTGNSSWARYDNCSFQMMSTGASCSLIVGTSSGTISTIMFNNVTVFFGNIGDYVNVQSVVPFIWQNTGPILVSGSVVPTSLLIVLSNGLASQVLLEALDLSQISGNLWNPNGFYEPSSWLIKDCKLHPAAVVQTPAFFGTTIQLVRSSS